jgi:hypothetical protein
MIPADKLTAIAEGVVEKWTKTHGVDGNRAVRFTTEQLTSFVEIVLACGAAHEEHQRKHGR